MTHQAHTTHKVKELNRISCKGTVANLIIERPRQQQDSSTRLPIPNMFIILKIVICLSTTKLLKLIKKRLFCWEQNLTIFFFFLLWTRQVNARDLRVCCMCEAFAGFFLPHTHSKLFFSAKGNVMGASSATSTEVII